MTDTPALERLDELIGTLQQVRHTSDPLERARMVRSLDRVARAVLGLVGDEAVLLSSSELVGTRRRSHAEIGDALGVTAGRVNNAIVAYRAWVAAGCP